MKRAAWVFALLVPSGCTGAMKENATPAATDYYADQSLWGTDAHLAPEAPDAVLRYGEGERAFAELRMPEGEGPFPLAVIYHGGCWKTGIATQAYMAPLATRWRTLGVATLNVDYREVGDGGGWTGSFEDWQASAKLIDEVAASYPIDRDRVTLVGHSAGATPAQWLAAEQGADGPVGARPALKVRAAQVFDGPADVGAERASFDALCQFGAVDPFMGGAPNEVPERFAAIAPEEHPPLVEEIRFEQAVMPAAPEAAQAAVRAGGAQLTVHVNEGASHFAIITPGDPVYKAIEPDLLKVLRGQ
ncbi:alpha/beta hydrolase fold domain-containing protein [Altererythrobacter salegens]|uniref:Alpha/beta hydrolase fold domain-containing protein n=1 Tax=Croceibacterium salegens TaxID=1737568 RepID=A0A6I4SRY6_9SPHN|nr:alpha/beta hydrolase fold domain-containing protein [Croceibacterium salegens]MXO58643.1 alpha/beta hydrolase fold domain-containing protein [Croceibacterium salegens]